MPISYVPDEAVHQERGDNIERVANTATSLEAVQDSSNIAKIQSTTTPTEPISQENGSDGSHRRLKTMGYDTPGINDFMYKIVRKGSSFGIRFKADKEAKVLADATRVHTYSRRRRAFSTDSGGVSTASRIVSTAGIIQQVNIIIPLSSATKDKAEKQKMAQVHQAAQGFTEVEWKDIRARVEADEELTHKLQA
ncbi:hypothetical protein Tco_0960739 [Tanacetum coccineum]